MLEVSFVHCHSTSVFEFEMDALSLKLSQIFVFFEELVIFIYNNNTATNFGRDNYLQR